MINIFKNIIFIIISFTAFMLVASPSSIAALDCVNPQTAQEQLQCGACHGSGVSDASCADASKQSTNSINSTITTVINLISLAAGIIAVIMLVVGAIRYITSSGNEQSVAAAKKTIMYALIGLVIVVLSQVIVRFTLSKATQTNKTGTSSSSSTGTNPVPQGTH